MNVTISLDSLLSFIHSLSLDTGNKRWLGEKLLEEARQEEAKATIAAHDLYGVWQDDDFPGLSADEMVREIKASRKFKDNVIAY